MKTFLTYFYIACAITIVFINISTVCRAEPQAEYIERPAPVIYLPDYADGAPDMPEPEEAETVETAEVEETEASNSLGEFRITAYTPYCDGGKWGYQTATGATSEHLATCAVDPEVIPLGSVIHIGGLELRAVDTGSAVKGNVVDIFCDSTQAEARRWIQEFGTSHEVEVREG